MNGWLELEEKRNLFLACLRVARFYPLGALALLFFLKAPLANAQVTPVPPFVGTNSETWEEFPIETIGSRVISILEGTATISGTRLETDGPGMFLLCYGFAMPSDGVRFMGANSLAASITISFSQPVSAFGAYWGSVPLACNLVGPTEFSFYDASGNPVGGDSFDYNPPMTHNLPMDWHGYAFATPVKTITIQGGWVCTDGMQVTVYTHPPFFNGETALGGGWYYLQFPNGTPFGYYIYLPDQNFIYHIDLGFEYLFDANDANHGIFFYDFASSSFFYTSPSTFPYLYDFSLNAWLYYSPDVNNPGRYTHDPRWFYNFATGQWVTL
jgi:hypothetical protein